MLPDTNKTQIEYTLELKLIGPKEDGDDWQLCMGGRLWNVELCWGSGPSVVYLSLDWDALSSLA
jgi:hypothetical protein